MQDAAQPDFALATLFATLVETLDETAPGLARSFAVRLRDAQARLAETPATPDGALQTLAWTQALLADELDRGQPACVVYFKDRPRDEDVLPSSEKVQLATLDEAVRFWERLPDFDRSRAAVETAQGHRIPAAEVADLAKRLRTRPAV